MAEGRGETVSLCEEFPIKNIESFVSGRQSWANSLEPIRL